MIEIAHLTKRFGDYTAVEDVSFHVGQGECVGFLGPNGAGKTTTMRILAGIFPPTTGVVRLGGHDVTREPAKARRLLGYFPEHAPYYPEMTVEGYLRFVARAKRIPAGEHARHVDRALEACDLVAVRKRLVGKLSKGYRQRVSLSQALLGDPAVLVLDEPTSGLDPAQVTEIRDLIKSLRGERTILLSSHILAEVSQVAQRVVIIRRGNVVAEGDPEELAGRFAGLTVWLRADAPLAALRAMVAALPGVTSVEEAEGRVRVGILDEAVVAVLSRAVTERGWTILELAPQTLSLEEIFLRLVGDARSGAVRGGDDAAATPDAAEGPGGRGESGGAR